MDVSLNLITPQQEAEEADVELEAFVENMNMTKHSLLLLKEVIHKRTKDYKSLQSGTTSDASSIHSRIITEKPQNVNRTRFRKIDQRIGRCNSPYAQKLRLGWVVIGEKLRIGNF